MDVLQQHYENPTDLYVDGFNQLLTLFPQMGVVDPVDVPLPETWPGNMSLDQFIVNNAHSKEDVIVK